MAIEAEKGAIETVAEQTSLMKRKILHQRKMMGGVNAAKENEHMVQKQVGAVLAAHSLPEPVSRGVRV